MTTDAYSSQSTEVMESSHALILSTTVTNSLDRGWSPGLEL